MARIRTIKPSFYLDDRLAELSLLARFIFPGLWMLSDRRGRLEDRPKRIKTELLPYQEADMDVLLDELRQGGYITRYVAEVDGKPIRVIQVNGFEQHQRIGGDEAKTESRFPEPSQNMPEKDFRSMDEASPKQVRSSDEAGTKHGRAREGKGKEGKRKGTEFSASAENPAADGVSLKSPKQHQRPKRELSPQEQELRDKIRAVFDDQNKNINGDPWYAKPALENTKVKELVLLIKSAQPDDPLALAQAILETFRKLTLSRKGKLANTPFTPSMLMTNWILQTVLQEIKKTDERQEGTSSLLSAIEESEATQIEEVTA